MTMGTFIFSHRPGDIPRMRIDSNRAMCCQNVEHGAQRRVKVSAHDDAVCMLYVVDALGPLVADHFISAAVTQGCCRHFFCRSGVYIL